MGSTSLRQKPGPPEPSRRCYLRALFFFGVATVPGNSASVQAFDICLLFLAVSRFTAAVACALAEPATLLAPLRKTLKKGFFIGGQLFGLASPCFSLETAVVRFTSTQVPVGPQFSAYRARHLQHGRIWGLFQGFAEVLNYSQRLPLPMSVMTPCRSCQSLLILWESSAAFARLHQRCGARPRRPSSSTSLSSGMLANK